MAHQLLTADEAAQLKEVTVAAIYAAVKENRLPHTRMLRRIGLREKDVLEWTPRSYAGRLGAKGGRPKGIAMKEDVKARISAAQKRRWAEHRHQQSLTEIRDAK